MLVMGTSTFFKFLRLISLKNSEETSILFDWRLIVSMALREKARSPDCESVVQTQKKSKVMKFNPQMPIILYQGMPAWFLSLEPMTTSAFF